MFILIAYGLTKSYRPTHIVAESKDPLGRGAVKSADTKPKRKQTLKVCYSQDMSVPVEMLEATPLRVWLSMGETSPDH